MTLAHYVKVVARRIFAAGVASTMMGLYLGFSGGFDDLAWLLTIGGAIAWAVFGNVWMVFRHADSHIRD